MVDPDHTLVCTAADVDSLLDDDALYLAAKTNGNFPGNPDRSGLPAIQGVIVLCDAENGFPLAVMGSGTVTSRRTAAATAVAARHLARRDATEATVIAMAHFNRLATERRIGLRAISKATNPDEVIAPNATRGLAATGQAPQHLAAGDVEAAGGPAL